MKTRPTFFFFSISKANLIIIFRKNFLIPKIRLHKLKIQYGCLITKYSRKTSTKKIEKVFSFLKKFKLLCPKLFQRYDFLKNLRISDGVIKIRNTEVYFTLPYLIIALIGIMLLNTTLCPSDFFYTSSDVYKIMKNINLTYIGNIFVGYLLFKNNILVNG